MGAAYLSHLIVGRRLEQFNRLNQFVTHRTRTVPMQPFAICILLLLLGVTFAEQEDSELLHVSSTSSRQIDADLGPVSGVLENMALNTASHSAEVARQLNEKFERVSGLLGGNIEVLQSTAMNSLVQPIQRAHLKRMSENCSLPWTMDELYERIDTQLQNCSLPVAQLRNSFEQEVFPLAHAIQAATEEIMRLPETCFKSGSQQQHVSFAQSMACFVEELGKINQLLTVDINTAHIAILRTRKLSDSTVEAARNCADSIVVEVIEFLDEALRNC